MDPFLKGQSKGSWRLQAWSFGLISPAPLGAMLRQGSAKEETTPSAAPEAKEEAAAPKEEAAAPKEEAAAPKEEAAWPDMPGKNQNKRLFEIRLWVKTHGTPGEHHIGGE